MYGRDATQPFVFVVMFLFGCCRQAFGKRTFLITTLKSVPPGTEGAVSLEGTIAGVGGSLMIAGFAAAAGVISTQVLFLPCSLVRSHCRSSSVPTHVTLRFVLDVVTALGSATNAMMIIDRHLGAVALSVRWEFCDRPWGNSPYRYV